jgi:hypothetical protein
MRYIYHKKIEITILNGELGRGASYRAAYKLETEKRDRPIVIIAGSEFRNTLLIVI